MNPASWTSAQTSCINGGGNLAEITSAVENSFLVHLRDNYSDKNAWIGLRKANNKGTYTWVSSGNDPIFTFWASGQPNLAASLEGCVEIWWAGKWNDLQCETKRPYFCERSVIGAYRLPINRTGKSEEETISQRPVKKDITVIFLLF
ncbi:galactose-specific lectin nattectin-like [Mercenaria mercenaria]|uniref:galactose-specific lectin nattectin-like n=1 Tax=Mercenaria mercenaria TaxID=6596 RepID=UPI00234EC432|nr:galactose-specific lectin nattectin-like [Mercenaria mercenaria]